MSVFRQDPGPCPICGAPHCSCGGGDPIVVVQLPQRDAAAAAVGPAAVSPPAADAASALGDGSDGRPFSTATYRGPKDKRRR